MKNLTKEQKKIYLIAIVAFVLLFIFWVFIALPQGRRLSFIKVRLRDTEDRIKQITGNATQEELARKIEKANAQFAKIAKRFPLNSEGVINSLSEQAKAYRIIVKNINLSPRTPLQQDAISSQIEEMVISMNLSCEYMALGKYLDALRDNFPFAIRIKSLVIRGGGEGQFNLDVELGLAIYLTRSGT
jgi:hypothetical protein